MRIFSGIQPTGQKHLGNYVGAIRQYVEGQDRADAIYCIVDLHAITVPYEPDELRANVYDTTAVLLAAGLDPERCTLFRQGDLKEHTELVAGDVITLEPGTYRQGYGGVRLEDLVLVSEDGSETLTDFPYELTP